MALHRRTTLHHITAQQNTLQVHGHQEPPNCYVTIII